MHIIVERKCNGNLQQLVIVVLRIITKAVSAAVFQLQSLYLYPSVDGGVDPTIIFIAKTAAHLRSVFTSKLTYLSFSPSVITHSSLLRRRSEIL